MNYSKLCINCWEMVPVGSPTDDATCGSTYCRGKQDRDEMTPLMWACFPHYQIIKNGTIEGVTDMEIRELVFDYVIPECRLAIDFLGDIQLVPPVGNAVDMDARQLRIYSDEAKEAGARQMNWRWISLSKSDPDVRNKLISLINEVYVKDIDGGVHVLTPRLQGDAGWDLVCDADTVCMPGVGTDIPSQVYLEIPNHLYAIVQARSSTSKKRLLVLPGVIDPSYRGQIFTMTFNPTNEPVLVKKGDRISQLLFFYRIPHLHINPVTELRQSERGSRGFGSTG
jgi:dUTP pyrophosphatase